MQVYLEDDVDRMDDASAYFPLAFADHTRNIQEENQWNQSQRSIDLLLGTQVLRFDDHTISFLFLHNLFKGWRRFAY